MVLGQKTVTFECEADGTPTLKYCWKFNANIMPGVTEKTLTLKNVRKIDEGTYHCVVKNDYDSATSSAELRIGRLMYTSPLDKILKPIPI